MDDVYVDLSEVPRIRIIVKCESFNFAGSVKHKAAVSIVAATEEPGRLRPGSVIVESSSATRGSP